jgi:hypothetical protein
MDTHTNVNTYTCTNFYENILIQDVQQHKCMRTNESHNFCSPPITFVVIDHCLAAFLFALWSEKHTRYIHSRIGRHIYVTWPLFCSLLIRFALCLMRWPACMLARGITVLWRYRACTAFQQLLHTCTCSSLATRYTHTSLALALVWLNVFGVTWSLESAAEASSLRACADAYKTDSDTAPPCASAAPSDVCTFVSIAFCA